MSDQFVQVAPDSSGKKVRTFENSILGRDVEAQAVTPIDGTGLTDSYVQVEEDELGKPVQYFQNTIGGNEVHAAAVVLVGQDGAPI